MSAYQFIAVDVDGKQHKGLLEGDSTRHIQQQLKQRQLTPLLIQPCVEQPAKASMSRYKRRHSLKTSEVTLITRQLAILIAAAVPIEAALATVAAQSSSSPIKTVLLNVRSQVLEGASLAQSLKLYPWIFSNLYRATIAAGEQSGDLAILLTQLADYLEEQQTLKQKIQQALIYPAAMMIISLSIVTFLMIFVIPALLTIFDAEQQNLPLMTRLLLGISHAVEHYGLYGLTLLIGSLLGLKYLLTIPLWQQRRDQALLKLPVIGRLLKLVDSTRFCYTLSILLSAGVPVIKALNVSCELVYNQVMKTAFNKATEQIAEGGGIAQAFKYSQIFQPMSLHLIASGERSGQLSAMLQRVAAHQDAEIRRFIDILLKLLEPIIIVFMGTVVLFIVLAVLLPIFNLQQLSF